MILCFCFTPFKILSFALLSSVHQPVNAYFVDFIWCKVAGDFSYFPRKCYTPNLTLVWLFWPMISFFCVKFTVSCKKFFLQPWIRLLLILHHSLMEPLGMYEVSVSGVCVCVWFSVSAPGLTLCCMMLTHLRWVLLFEGCMWITSALFASVCGLSEIIRWDHSLPLSCCACCSLFLCFFIFVLTLIFSSQYLRFKTIYAHCWYGYLIWKTVDLYLHTKPISLWLFIKYVVWFFNRSGFWGKLLNWCLPIVKFRFLTQGLQDKIKLVAIHLQDKPAWYKEKLYPENKVHFDFSSFSFWFFLEQNSIADEPF